MLIFALPLLGFAQGARGSRISGDISVNGVFGYNTTWNWYGGGDIRGVMHIDNIDFHLDFEGLSANVYSIGLTASPHFDVCENGQVFLDGTMHSRIFCGDGAYEFIYAGSAGYRMRHFSVQAGVFARVIDALGRDWHSVDNYIVEPFNVMYKVALSIKGFDNPWDIYFTGSNYNEFEYERVWQPIFMMGGRVTMNERFSVWAEGTLKPTGMFHLTATYYESLLKVGVNYKL